ncbi:MAG TPA: acyloxyacyl hydrolase [Hyphomicrobiales bacterium]|nr:acyloxyacyl hydrolase [Hyphomicrobiales bacterium]
MQFSRLGVQVAATFLFAASSMVQPACADGLVSEVKVGVLAHDVPDLWSGFQREEDSVDINAELLLSPSAVFFGGTLRPAIGASVNTAGDTSHAYIDARWQYDFPDGLFFSAGLGGAVHDGNLDPSDPDRKALGSRLLFHIPVELGYQIDDHNNLSVYFEHTSNGYTQDFNEGLDRLGIRYGYRY